MRSHEYEKLDGISLLEMLYNGQVNPYDLMKVAIQLAEERGSALNALCCPAFDLALEKAKNPKLRGPFGGLPFLLKDSGLAAKSLPSDIGSRLFSNTQSKVDSTLVERFEAAGFNSFARTTVPELCMAPTTEAVQNGGPTLNPWDRSRSSGGSSGGAAAAVAAGIVPIAHGSDGGGSIRIPASCCGVFGLKPSRGLLTMGPSRGEGWGGLAVDGVISRTVRDTAAALDAVKGFDPGSPYAAPPSPSSFFMNLEKSFDRPLRIAKWTSTWDGIPVHPDCLAAVGAAEKLLIQNRHEVVEVAPPPINYDRFVNALIDTLAANAVVAVDAVSRGAKAEVISAGLEPAIYDAYLYGKTIHASEYIRSLTYFHTISRIMEQYMTGFDLVLTPTLTQLPLKLGELSMKDDFRSFRKQASRYTMFLAIINASGQPAASVPLHWNESGLPIGVQLIGHFGDEDLILRVSAELERAAPWHAQYANIVHV